MSSCPHVTGESIVAGVFGWPIKHSLSPIMHNAAFVEAGLSWIYVPFEVHPEKLGSALRSLPSLGIVGVNLTIPHKEKAVPYMDVLTTEASQIGAINTVHSLSEIGLLGDNTDGDGFYYPLSQSGFEVGGRSALILGAGGAARAVAFRLAKAGAKLIIANRTLLRATALAEDVSNVYPTAVPQLLPLEESSLEHAVQEVCLIVNTTRIGMHPDTNQIPPIPLHSLRRNTLVYDLVYNPIETLLLKEARKLGCKTVDGVHMLAGQGAASWERWTGRKAPRDVMEQAVREELNTRTLA